MTMNKIELKDYLNDHLKSELEWLLRATTEWYVQDQIKLEIPGYEVQVFAMDSSFLHARVLFEFFTKKLDNNSNNYYGCKEYIGIDIPSTLYTDNWKTPIHTHLMHAQNRSGIDKLQSFGGSPPKELNKMPVDFAKEIVRLWKEFTRLLINNGDPEIQSLGTITKSILADAISNAEKVVTFEMIKDGKKIERGEIVKQKGVEPISW